MSNIIQRITNLWRRRVGNVWFYPIRGNSFEKVDPLLSYLQIPEVNAVVNMKANSFSNVLFEGTSSADKQLITLLNQPNWYQSGKEFLFQTKVFQEIFGNEFIYVLRPFAMQDVKALYSLPKNLFKVEYTSKLPYFLTDKPQVKYSYMGPMGEWKELDSENVIHLAGARINYTSFTDSKNLMATSPMDSLAVNINNIRMAYETRGVFLRNRGAVGILSNEGKDGIGNPFPFNQEEIDRLQELYRNYGSLDGQYQIIISNQSVKWQQMAIAPDKLGLFQEVDADFDRILDAFGVPGDLFVRKQGSTYENQKQAELGLYVRTIIPEMNEWIAGINGYFGTTITASYAHLPVFSDEQLKKTKALSEIVNVYSQLLAQGIITKDDYLRAVEGYLI